jgi:hypothetical protein
MVRLSDGPLACCCRSSMSRSRSFPDDPAGTADHQQRKESPAPSMAGPCIGAHGRRDRSRLRSGRPAVRRVCGHGRCSSLRAIISGAACRRSQTYSRAASKVRYSSHFSPGMTNSTLVHLSTPPPLLCGTQLNRFWLERMQNAIDVRTDAAVGNYPSRSGGMHLSLKRGHIRCLRHTRLTII